MTRIINRGIFCALLVLLQTGLRAATPTVIYSTGFETSEGYDPLMDLEGQQGWLGTGGDSEGDNGLTEGFFTDQGQQAYIGFLPLAAGNDALFVWQPLDLNPIPADKSLIKFSVDMAIVNSTNMLYDCFRWSVYNAETTPLFTIDFDNSNLGISYELDDGKGFFFTGATFTNDTPSHLLVTMDFSQNQWSASFNGSGFATDLPITTVGSPLTLGDIDAVWVLRDTNAPGNNFMVFDNYQVTGEPPGGATPQPRLQVLPFSTQGAFQLHLAGQSGQDYAIEVSTNLTQWSAIATNTATGGAFDFTDPASPGTPYRFYRARLVP